MGTPLHCAVSETSAQPHEHLGIVKLLLARGAKRWQYTIMEEVPMSIRKTKYIGGDSSFFEKYLELMENTTRKLGGKSKVKFITQKQHTVEKEAQEKEGLLLQVSCWLVTNRAINRDMFMME